MKGRTTFPPYDSFTQDNYQKFTALKLGRAYYVDHRKTDKNKFYAARDVQR